MNLWWRDARGFAGMDLIQDVVAEPNLKARLAALRQEHRDLDAAIEALRAIAAQDQLQLARLKKRKLRLKDEIALLEDLAVPDIIA